MHYSFSCGLFKHYSSYWYVQLYIFIYVEPPATWYIIYWYVFDLLHAFSMLLFKSFPQSGTNLRKWWLWKSRLQELSSVFTFWIIRNNTKVLWLSGATGFSKASCQDRKSTESFCWLKIVIVLRWWKSGKTLTSPSLLRPWMRGDRYGQKYGWNPIGG